MVELKKQLSTTKNLKKIPNSTLIMLPLCSLLLEDSKNLKDIKKQIII